MVEEEFCGKIRSLMLDLKQVQALI